MNFNLIQKALINILIEFVDDNLGFTICVIAQEKSKHLDRGPQLASVQTTSYELVGMFSQEVIATYLNSTPSPPVPIISNHSRKRQP